MIHHQRFAVGIRNCWPARWAVSRIQEAEALGAETAFIAEDVFCRDAFVLAGVAAMGTASIHLATGVVNPYTRTPLSIAMATATLDEVSGGRSTLGLGTGPFALLEKQVGIDPGNSVGRMRECAAIVRRLLAGESVTYDGRSFTYRDTSLQVLPVRGRVPMYFAAMGPKMLRLAGAVADGVLLNLGGSIEYVRWAVGLVREAAIQAGRQPDEVTVAAWLAAYVTDDQDAGLRAARGLLATMLAIPRQGELLLQGLQVEPSFLTDLRARVAPYPDPVDRVAAARHVPAELARRLALVGTAKEVSEGIQRYREAGVDLPVLLPGPLATLLSK